MSADSISIAITGSGGSGAVTTGLILLQAMAKAGYYGYLSRSSGPQIRGGESAVMMRFAGQPVHCLDDRFDLLLALDWNRFERFADEIPLDDHSLVLGDTAAGDMPAILGSSGAHCELLDFSQSAKTISGGRANMLGLGLLCEILGLQRDNLQKALDTVLAKKGEQVIMTSMQCIEQGMQMPLDQAQGFELPTPVADASLWNISGNEAGGLGALRAGVRFVAAYPITPASDMLEWLAPKLEKIGGVLLQAEDELAAVNMITGASFGGVASMTATSGPGLSLMMEGLGLAVASEIPVVVINVMRGGPSTGIPTKSEQSDLNLALYGMHGDAPHVVTAALNVADCVLTAQWSVALAEQLQTVCIMLSDQSLGQSRVIIDAPAVSKHSAQRKIASDIQPGYHRYQLTDNAISAMSIPGTPGGMYTADGLEHNEFGTPSSMATDHQAQLDKRLHKFQQIDFADDWAELSGDGEVLLFTWGSSMAVCQQAAERLSDEGMPTGVIALRLLMPLNHQGITEALQGRKQVVVVEQNQGAQFFHYLHSQQLLPSHAVSYARPGPLPLRAGNIVQFVRDINS